MDSDRLLKYRLARRLELGIVGGLARASGGPQRACFFLEWVGFVLWLHSGRHKLLHGLYGVASFVSSSKKTSTSKCTLV
jgi:hypothetical protein